METTSVVDNTTASPDIETIHVRRLLLCYIANLFARKTYTSWSFF